MFIDKYDYSIEDNKFRLDAKDESGEKSKHYAALIKQALDNHFINCSPKFLGFENLTEEEVKQIPSNYLKAYQKFADFSLKFENGRYYHFDYKTNTDYNKKKYPTSILMEAEEFLHQRRHKNAYLLWESNEILIASLNDVTQITVYLDDRHYEYYEDVVQYEDWFSTIANQTGYNGKINCKQIKVKEQGTKNPYIIIGKQNTTVYTFDDFIRYAVGDLIG